MGDVADESASVPPRVEAFEPDGDLWMGRWVPKRAQRAVVLATLLFGSVFSYLFISNVVFDMVTVSGESMYPTLHSGEMFALQIWRYHFSSPEFGDIVAIRDPLDNRLSVKRIIGLPGERIEIDQGEVMRNGEHLIEPYLKEQRRTHPVRNMHSIYVLGEHEYFLMGDNRRNSVDSRTYGGVERDRILGEIRP